MSARRWTVMFLSGTVTAALFAASLGAATANELSRPVEAQGNKGPVEGAKKTIGDELAAKPKLLAKLQPLLPEGANIQEAVKGFRKLDDFAAAAHAAKNLGIAFTLMKAKVIGGDTLVKAIHALDPTVDAKAEAKKAEEQAKADLKAGG